jgi:hypothetical protein
MLNLRQNQIINKLEEDLTQTKHKTNEVKQSLEKELDRFERKIHELEGKLGYGIAQEKEL